MSEENTPAEGAVDVVDKYVVALKKKNVKIVTFDMDRTMSSSHCGSGLLRSELQTYISSASHDFQVLAKRLHHHGLRMAVATGSDPVEYEIKGQSRETHILGPDLATALITSTIPETLPTFGIMVGHDPRLHSDVQSFSGKSFHMRKIQEFYRVSFEEMILIDDYAPALINDDGWIGVRVLDPLVGFRLADLNSFCGFD
eukprot:CAMPEP_0201497300 /NCGR_PEP_ID=MMETSP0151_2-20130828/64773_1 /ASSEMBLY_ACC=CAM_ASM_000257 /TAXON_ID=200890 /ORGANISM="Paramoeba atlantica, Strain 621/1 / CCAP 1560/9" /LENGTH=198 /DNA_ID=CAMNT_0047887859 /DNA_START=24 /DNA_END=620 /DNA_ORIENTATION=+